MLSDIIGHLRINMEVPLRQKSQRKINKRLANHGHFDQFRNKSRTVTSPTELLPGLNDISDAFEALPMDLVKYFTLLKEIDAKCINTVPQINGHIKKYLQDLPEDEQSSKRLQTIGNKIHEIIPCLEEKMHVTTVATDVLYKHMYRINQDYQLIINNNEIPELIRIGPLNHPAMISDANGESNHANRSAQLTRSESRREALAAKKVVRDDDDKKRRRDVSPSDDKKKKPRGDDNSRSGTPTVGSSTIGKKRTVKPRRDEEGSVEPTYCYCNQVSFGEMVGCDGSDCKREWFHLPCIGFKNPPKGRWYCDDCLAKMKKRRV